MRATYIHYLAVGVLLLVCFCLGYTATRGLSLYDASTATVPAKDLADAAGFAFEKINKINFLAYFGLCASAVFIYTKTQDAWLFVVNVLAHFLGLCIIYFWVGDMLLVFEQHHDLDEGGFSGSLIIVPIKLLFAVIFAAVSLVLARALVKARQGD